VDAETRTIKVRAELSNPRGELRPEMFAQIRSKQGEKALPTVSKGALLQLEGQNIVYVERAAGEFEEVPVRIGWQAADRVAIAAGINPGDRFVVDGAMLLRAINP
jgi:multidrug efflux pump subunit AcrA (membrane-fusion protein)